MQARSLIPAALVVALIQAPAFAQTVAWRVVAANDGDVTTPGLPGGVDRYLADFKLGHAGADQVGFRVSTPSASAGYWALRDGVLSRYMQTDVDGDLGPGRVGDESGHVLLDYAVDWGDAAADGQRIFAARAGDPNLPVADASYGVWRHDATRNIEIARSLTDGVLGPGLGSGWTFPDQAEFSSGWSLDGGAVLLSAKVDSPTSARRYLIALHRPGQGNQPCLLTDSTDPTLAPGLGANAYFDSSWSPSDLAVGPGDRIYGEFSASGAGSRQGIWELCDGAPAARAVDEETGARGPDLGIETAYFQVFYGHPVPAADDSFYFVATGRESVGGAGFGGLFRHDGTRNVPVALNGDAGAYSPHWEDATFRSIREASLSAAGEYVAFEAALDTADGGDPDGLWRHRVGEVPEPVAIIGVIGAWAPEPNRTWASFRASAILSNGDILLEAHTDPGNEYALWLLQAGHAPRRVLEIGQNVAVPTAAGLVQAPISSFELPDGDGVGASYSRGVDSWIGADGTILVRANVSGYGIALLLAQPSNPVDPIFADGFDP